MKHPEPRRSILGATAVLALLASVVSGDRGLAADPPSSAIGPRVEFRTLGVSVEVPPGVASVVRVREDGVPRAFLSRPIESPPWTIAIEPFRGATATDQPREAIDEVIDYLQSLRDAGVTFTIRVNRPFATADREGHFLLLERSLGTTEPDAAEGTPPAPTGILGYLVVPRDSGEYVAASIAMTPQSFEASRAEVEALLGTMRVQDGEQQRTFERSLLDAGRRREASFREDRLRELADGEVRWYRLHRPAVGEEPVREVGCLAVRATIAPQGLVDGSRDPAGLRDSEREEGLLVVIEGRMLPPETAAGTSREMLDLSLRAWTSLDRTSEAWSLRQTIRGSRAEPTNAETGLRARPTPAQPRSVLEVIIANRESMSREPRRFPLPDEPYATQAELALLGPLLAPLASAGGEFAWRAYDRRLGEVPRRVEQIVPLSDPPGGFEVRTLLHPDDPQPTIQRFDSEGRLLERRDLDGTVTTPIDPEDLRRLWQRKRLPEI